MRRERHLPTWTRTPHGFMALRRCASLIPALLGLTQASRLRRHVCGQVLSSPALIRLSLTHAQQSTWHGLTFVPWPASGGLDYHQQLSPFTRNEAHHCEKTGNIC
ncbi:uncharacterized protein SEPMUDRAFT_151731 [Sphaerulina musiva SO2202]|uniref:Uncharacterized protein n=1 Tax=Sphaerulina musiva (strain SO2202) TaxID=692275 RepID=M3ATF5_SPHMS|nr:uncharacterized protein SEPMUDRAFT_151731 [Sphaerulina musiva SO2202]EMF08799.1 hypothetical protein SEPMUDRAFT_151731 [Sphaerulina musiva SO2202]